MSIIERVELSGVVPEEWRDNYQDLALTKGPSGHDYLYGIKEDGHKGPRLSWEPLDKSIHETYGIEPEKPYPALWAVNAELKQQNESLTQEITHIKAEMVAMEDRFNLRIQELEARLDPGPTIFDPDRFKKVQQWKPSPGEELIVRDGPEDNTLTIESIDPSASVAKVRNPEGISVNKPLAELSRYWHAEQIRKRNQTNDIATEDSLKGRLQRSYDRLIRRRTEAVPTVLVNEEGESAVMVEEKEVEDKRPLALAGLAATLLLAGFIGYELNNGKEDIVTRTTTITKTVPRPLPANQIVVGKNRYEVLLNEEKKLEAIEAANSRLKHEVQALENQGSSAGPPASRATETSLNYRGDTVWNEVAKRVREKLGYRATDKKIRKATAYVLRLNGLRWSGGGYGVDAHRLPVGLRFKIPENIVAIANK